jgi:anaerobic magnesium-protoporphyrin IX monomethyl ester cyclase
MKVLFIYKYANYEPLGLMTLSAVLKKAGHESQYIDASLEKNIIKRVIELSPDIIAYSIITGSHKYYRDLNLTLKQHLNFLALFGGPHCTFFPEFINEEGVDVICRGEAEKAIITLVDFLQKGKDISSIPNLWIKKEGKIYQNEIENLCLNLDEIPFPDRDFVNVYKHYNKMQRRDVITSRGCPYNCTYCFNHANKELFRHKGRYVRQRSVDNVIEELKQLKDKYHAKVFHFQDDVFTVNHQWTFDFCSRYQKEIKLPFEVQLRGKPD